MSSEIRDKIESVAHKARQLRLGSLELPSRARRVLKSRRIKNSYDAMVYILDHLDKEKGIGPTTLREARAATAKLVSKLVSLDQESRGILNHSHEEYFTPANGNLAQVFPGLVELYHDRKTGSKSDRNLDVIRKRFGLNGSAIYTLQDLGTYYDVTKVRIQQVESKAIREIGQLLSGSFSPSGWRPSKEIIESYVNLRQKIADFGLLVARDELDEILTKSYGLSLEFGHLDLLLATLGYVKVPAKITGFRGRLRSSWYEQSRINRRDLEMIFQSLDIVFDSPQPRLIFDVVLAVKKRSKKKISKQDVERAIAIVADFELREDHVLVRFQRLRSVADQAFRVLEAHGEPMRYTEIAFQINSRNREQQDFKAVGQKNLRSQMTVDRRFMPIGRSGDWVLSSWPQYRNLTMQQALEHALHKAGKALDYSELVRAVKSLRPNASEKSIRSYLSDRSSFTCVSHGKFGLTSWRGTPVKKEPPKRSVSEDVFIDVVKSVFIRENPVSVSRALKWISAQIELSEGRIQERLRDLDGIEIRQAERAGSEELYCVDVNSLSSRIGKRRRTLRDRVEEEIKSILHEQPNDPMTKGELFRLVSRNVSCGRYTFYQYLARMDGIHQFREGKEFFAVYRHEEKKRVIPLDIAQYGPSNRLIAVLARPMAKLTMEEIDIALYELGLHFENALRSYLVALRRWQPEKVGSRDTKTLANMVNCVVREGVVSKGHHLTILREERNERAHGAVPSVDERRILFNKAHYIADLFLRYICLFDNEAKNLGGGSA